MPTYEYHCKKCGIVFETFQGIAEKALEKCTNDVCPLGDAEKGTGEVERLISAGAGLMFKGSGFYITDYKSGEKKGTSSPTPSKPKVDKLSPPSSGGTTSS